ncbi:MULTISPECIES: hypothetical protein [Nocardia]|uniref:Uncharacterized protein n=2 Tax=Nocardia otitidiscaviarum TaxID=1823 RepID=A0A516NJW8_9NOCA|nr:MULTISPECIES: hypothetical protein [Nocardia]MBF6180221.1 hypothetical protein [Nocardia otitidiscaviarum]MCP9625157.1 hypothetical protein [Nocardia otitidiscaviarum]QDP79198.1 hypothetical protein FOH10_11140 [Nocardia otitidiscaviarum]
MVGDSSPTISRRPGVRGVRMNQPINLSRLGFADDSRHEQHYSRETATAFVIDKVESTGAATRYDFDIERIVTTAHAMVNDWDLHLMQPEAFWRIASSFIRQ